MPLLDAQVPVAHRLFVLGTPTEPKRHGQVQEGTLSDPVTRYAYSVYPANWIGLRPDPINWQDYDETITTLVMNVPDPSVYHVQDTVTIHGKSFVVQGLPEFADNSDGTKMAPGYDSHFGGQVLIKRVG